jgi:acylphosphatase
MGNDVKLHVNIHVEGKVQGVFYRASTFEKAQALALAGFVRNEPDESVYIEAEGTPEQIDELIRWCRVGPARAQVSQVHVIPGDLKGYLRFEIRR